jgi:hypothetical protein
VCVCVCVYDLIAQDCGIWHSRVGIATRIRAGRSGVRKPVEENISLFFKNVQTGFGAHPALYSMGTEVLFRGKAVRGVMLTTHLHVAPRLGMSGAIPLSVYGQFPSYSVRFHFHPGFASATCWSKWIQLSSGFISLVSGAARSVHSRNYAAAGLSGWMQSDNGSSTESNISCCCKLVNRNDAKPDVRLILMWLRCQDVEHWHLRLTGRVEWTNDLSSYFLQVFYNNNNNNNNNNGNIYFMNMYWCSSLCKSHVQIQFLPRSKHSVSYYNDHP